MIREEYQNLGPMKCAAPGSLRVETELGIRLSGELPPGLNPGSLGAESQGNIRTNGLKWDTGDGG